MRYVEAKIINRYANRVLQRKTTKLNKDDWNEIGKDLIKNDKTRAFYSKKIVMSNIELANQRILEVLNRNNINLDTPFEILKKAREIAETKENSSDLIKIAKELIEIQDLKPQKVTISESRQVNSPDYDNLLKQKQTITVTKSVENGKFSRVNTSGDPQNEVNDNTNTQE